MRTPMPLRLTRRPKLVSFGALTACAVGLLAWGVASATTPLTTVTTVLSGPGIPRKRYHGFTQQMKGKILATTNHTGRV